MRKEIFTVAVALMSLIGGKNALSAPCGDIIRARVPSPVIYESTLKDMNAMRTPHTFGGVIDLMHQHRGYVAKKLGLDLVAVAKNPGIAFYLMQLELHPTPEMETFVDPIRVKSWVSDYSNDEKGATRVVSNFEFSESDGKVIVAGRALYAIVDTRTGKPVRFADEMWKYFVKGDFTPESQSSTRVKLFDLKAAGDSDFSTDYVVKPEDIDFYRHVGSGAYLSYCEKLLLDYGLDLRPIKEFDVQFLSSLTAVGTKFTGRVGPYGENAVKFVLAKEDGTPILVGRAVTK